MPICVLFLINKRISYLHMYRFIMLSSSSQSHAKCLYISASLHHSHVTNVNVYVYSAVVML